jgi:hypothetical protein
MVPERLHDNKVAEVVYADASSCLATAIMNDSITECITLAKI